jgi:hypothetical protein
MTSTSTQPLLQDPPLAVLPVEHLADLSVALEPAQVVPTPVGTKLVFIVSGGQVTGPALRGELLPGGGDSLHVGDDRIGRLNVRTTIRTHDDVLIELTVGGLISVPADGLDRLAAGERLPWRETYVRTTPRFETSDERYAWLCRLVAVAYNELAPNRIDYRMYRLL